MSTAPKLYEYNGKAQTLREWSNELGIKADTIRRRFKNGIPIDIPLMRISKNENPPEVPKIRKDVKWVEKNICLADHCEWAKFDGYTHYCTVCMDKRKREQARLEHEKIRQIQRFDRKIMRAKERLKKLMLQMEGTDDKRGEKSNLATIPGHRTQN